MMCEVTCVKVLFELYNVQLICETLWGRGICDLFPQ